MVPIIISISYTQRNIIEKSISFYNKQKKEAVENKRRINSRLIKVLVISSWSLNYKHKIIGRVIDRKL